MKYSILLFTLLFIVACDKKEEKKAENNATTQLPASQANTDTANLKPPFVIADSSKIVTTPEGLKYYIVERGMGNMPKDGNKIIAHYHGLLTDGTKFDSSYDRGQPFSFDLGKGGVIKGWDIGFKQFPVGTKAVLIIPSDLGYGEQGNSNIPGGATLVFHVQLLAANPA